MPACSCGSPGFIPAISAEQTSATLYPCVGNQLVNVTDYENGNGDGQKHLIAQCNSQLDLTAGSGPFLLQCLPPTPLQLRLTLPEFVFFYAIVAIQTVILLSYHIYRAYRTKRNAHHSLGASKQFRSLEDDHSLELSNIRKSSAPSNIRFYGYTKDPFGAFVMASIATTSIFWFFLMGIVIADYYEVFSGYNYRDSALLLGNHDNLSFVFIILWHVMAIWFITIKLNSSSLQTYFYCRTALSSSTHILVEKRVDASVAMNHGADPIVDFVTRIEATLKHFSPTEKTTKLTSVKFTPQGRQYIEFECVRYVFDSVTQSFQPCSFHTGPKNSDLVAQSVGLTASEAERRIELNGFNEIVFRVDTFAAGVIKEFTGIFYIYQLMMLLIWYYYAYYYMGIVITAVIVGSGIVKVVVSTTAQKRVLDMATFHGTCRVLRDGIWQTVDCRDLTIGDVIEVEVSKHVLFVDCVLVDGDVVVDESSLTGEALPVAKFAIKNDGVVYNPDEAGKVSTLYSGCHILETRPSSPKVPVTAIVTFTGASTTKGRLVRDILYPMPVSFVFYEHLKVVLPVLFIWGVIMLFLSMAVLNTANSDAWFYGMFTISQILSPLLPAVLVIGQSISSDRLRAQGITCVDLARITLAGKVKYFCFDKTGTLTKEGLDFLGVHLIDTSKAAFQAVVSQFHQIDAILQQAMHCCHSLSMVGDKFVGNFVDVEMFRATGASLVIGTPTVVHPSENTLSPLRILKRFEFVHTHAYMSVVAQEVTSGRIVVFLKGSAEKLREMVDQHSLPQTFDETTRQHSSNGCYVLGMARRVLPSSITVEMVQTMSRQDIERGATMIGLLLFRNELKPDTQSALAEIRNGGCRTVMITGDHVHTAIYVSGICGLIQKNWMDQTPTVILGDVIKSNTDQVTWTLVDQHRVIQQHEVDELVSQSRAGKVHIEIALTGKAFNLLIESQLIDTYIHDTRVFARMSPEDKVKCVRLHMKYGVTAMCGDGGNDAGALKAAHAGIALSEAESLVVSHFSSRNRSIFSCVDVLREARCSLDVSFASYKYLIMYGEILAFAGLLQYYFVVNMSEAMWILIDGSTVPVSWALTMAKPAARLIRSRPTARLLGAETLFSVSGQVIINILFLIIIVAVLYQQDFYRCHEFNGSNVDLRRWWELADSYESEVTGIIAVFQILHAAAAFNVGSKYRIGSLKNYTFVVVYSIIFILLACLTLSGPSQFSCTFHVNCGTQSALEQLGYSVSFNTPNDYFSPQGHNVLPVYFRWVVLVVAVINLVVVLFWERVAVLGVGREWVKRKWPSKQRFEPKL